MRTPKKALFLLILPFLLLNCKSRKAVSTEDAYKSETLRLIPLTANTYVHVSYLQTEQWGKVGCNGLVYVHKNEAIVFDTPATLEASKELVKVLREDMGIWPKAIVVNHFHVDCLAGLSAFSNVYSSAYANQHTLELAKQDSTFNDGLFVFENEQVLKLGSKKVINFFPGEAHTPDNIVSYIPSEKVLFGGCMVKSMKAGKGNLGDANVEAWPNSIRTVQQTFPNARWIVPGHGKAGGRELLDRTIEIFEE